MYKSIVLFAILAVCAGKPAPQPGLIAYSSPLVSPVVTSVVSPAVSSYSAYSSNVVHGSPVVPLVPVVHQPVVHQPLVHSVPLTYSAHVPTVLV